MLSGKLSPALRSAISADTTGLPSQPSMRGRRSMPTGRERTPAVAATGRGERSAEAMVADLLLDKYMLSEALRKKV
jgi:hypothetical protein